MRLIHITHVCATCLSLPLFPRVLGLRPASGPRHDGRRTTHDGRRTTHDEARTSTYPVLVLVLVFVCRFAYLLCCGLGGMGRGCGLALRQRAQVRAHTDTGRHLLAQNCDMVDPILEAMVCIFVSFYTFANPRKLSHLSDSVRCDKFPWI
jgi:hypothetical protein